MLWRTGRSTKAGSLTVRLADAFWRLFNRPLVTKLLAQLAAEGEIASREEGYYWRLVLRYCRDGNLQSVLDETWHLMWEQQAWSESTSRETVASECISRIAESVEPQPNRQHRK